MSDRLLEKLESALGDLKAVTRERIEKLASQHQARNVTPEPRAKEPSARPQPSGEELAKAGLIRAVSDGPRAALDAHSGEQFRGFGRIASVLRQLKLRLRPLLGHWR